MKNILVAVEINESDRKLLNFAKQLASKFSSKTWIIHVAAPDPDFVGYEVGPQYIRDARADTLKKEHRKLHEYLEILDEENIKSDALLIQGPTVEILEKEIDKLGIDMVVIGSHKHGFFYEALVGDTSTRLIKNVDIPVTIIPLK